MKREIHVTCLTLMYLPGENDLEHYGEYDTVYRGVNWSRVRQCGTNTVLVGVDIDSNLYIDGNSVVTIVGRCHVGGKIINIGNPKCWCVVHSKDYKADGIVGFSEIRVTLY